MAEEQQTVGSKTIKTTTIETTRRAYEVDGGSSIIGYRPTVAPRSVIIQRTSYGGGGSGGGGGGSRSSYSKERSVHYGSTGISPGAFASLTTSGVTEVKTSREKEKKDMQDLNERFASYIEKVRFLEAQNKRLVDELEKLKSKWGKETTQVKAMYQAELDEARRLLDDAEKEKARLEIRVASLEEIFQELRQRFSLISCRILCVFVRARPRVCVHVCRCVYCVDVYMYVCMYVRTYVRMYVCMYVCTCMYVYMYNYY